MDPISFQQLSVSVDTVLTLAYLLIVGFYVIFTGILYYHWDTYATDKKVTRLTMILYGAASLPLLILMGILLITM